MLNDMWNSLGLKLCDKIIDHKKLTTDELNQIQNRQRKFYKINLKKTQLDKFEPGN